MSYQINLSTAALGGNSSISTPKGGLVTLTDLGQSKVADLPTETWGILINQGAQAWVFGYEGGNGSTLTLTFDESGKLTPSGAGSMRALKYTKG